MRAAGPPGSTGNDAASTRSASPVSSSTPIQAERQPATVSPPRTITDATCSTVSASASPAVICCSRPSRSLAASAAARACRSAAYAPSRRRRASARSLMSTNVQTAAVTVPSGSWMGAALTTSVPRVPSPRSKSTSSPVITSPRARDRASGHSCGRYGRPSGWKPRYAEY